MSGKFISTIHIQKLGHNIQEIRERALFNIISKLDHGFVYDNDLARSKEILSRLFDWFSQEPVTHQDVVLKLVNRILTSPCGSSLIKHYGTKPLLNDLRQIRNSVHSTLYEAVDSIIEVVLSSEPDYVVVPPLQSDLPLSYRSQDAFTNIVESSATPIETFIHISPSPSPQAGADVCSETETSLQFLFKWQPLIGPDKEVLDSLEKSLRFPSEPTTLLDSCEFFHQVMLEDFPAEVFLQRPAILKLFCDYLKTSVSIRFTNAILHSLLKLAKGVSTRIYYYSDPLVHNNRSLSSNANTPISSATSSRQNFAKLNDENNIVLELQQLLVPNFCFLLFHTLFDYICVKPDSVRSQNQPKKSQVGINLALDLFDELMNVLNLCLKPSDWDKQSISTFAEIFKKLEDVLIRFSEILEHFRLESLNDNNKFDCATHLRLLHGCGILLNNLIPTNKADAILPRQFKNALSNTLLDPTLARLFPKIHETIFLHVKEFGGRFEIDSISKYNELELVCGSFGAAVKFLRNSSTLPPDVLVKLAKDAVLSVGFHKNLDFISMFVKLCAGIAGDLLESAEDVILKLMAYGDEEVQEETYKLCHKRIISAIGPKLNKSCAGAPGSQILFLLRSQILLEICCHGITHSNKQIQTYANEIILHILKCKLLVSEEIWNETIVAIIPILPILASYAGKNSNLSRIIVNILDPDTAKTLNLPFLEVVKGNLRLLYVDNYLTREEAISRLFWLLATQTNARNLLPQLNTLRDKELDSICIMEKVIDINKPRPAQHFYQNNALIQVLELLNSDLVERDIRRSALTQISVMMEDPLLHPTFIEMNGIKTIVGVMKSSLTENDKDYIDCIVPAVSILKNITAFNSGVRLELNSSLDIYFYILRGLFIFSSDHRLRQDSSTLLCLLLMGDFILGSPAKSDLSLPHIVCEKLSLPFKCNSHWRISKNTLPQPAATLLSDKWCLSSLQIHWNAHWFGGYKNILNWTKIDYQSDLQFNKQLCMTENDLQALKNSSPLYCMEKFLTDVENGTSHLSVIGSINKLEGCLRLYTFNTAECNLSKFAWENTFVRFLNTPPANEEDVNLLVAVTKFLIILVPSHAIEESNWLIKILQNPSHCFPNLLQVESAHDLDVVNLHRVILNLLIVCVRHEQNSLSSCRNGSNSWLNIIQILAEKIKFTNDFNFAHIGCVLSCLVHLTTALGWSRCTFRSVPEEPIPSLIQTLCKLLGIFYSNGECLMGAAITRHILLLVNHLLAELQSANAKGWEMCFIGEAEFEENVLVMINTVEQIRDAVIRAAIFQLLAGLALSKRCATYLLQAIKIHTNILEIALATLLNRNESSIVRENAAALLTNLVSHFIDDKDNQAFTMPKLILTKKPDGAIFLLLEEFQFFQELPKVVTAVYEKSYFMPNRRRLSNVGGISSNVSETNKYNKLSNRSNDFSNYTTIVTPSFIQKLAMFVHNLFLLAGDKVTTALNESGLVRMFFRLLVVPSVNINSTKNLSLYCDILEMNAAVCTLLTKVVANQMCLGVILSTRDCLGVMLSLLNPSLYNIAYPQLVYLRNHLWSKIFGLMAALLDGGWKVGDTQSIVSTALNECGHRPFLKTLCEAISSSCSTDLQQSALSSLTSLLRIDNDQVTVDNPPSISMVLDSVRTPRTPVAVDESESDKTRLSKNTYDMYHNIYFGSIRYDSKKVTNLEQEDTLIAGAELCRLLLQLYNAAYVNCTTNKQKIKFVIIDTLTSILSVSKEAKKFALSADFMEIIVRQLKELHIKLSLESVDCLRRLGGKKRICPILKEFGCLIGLITNFMLEDEDVKQSAATCGLADLIHKMWAWCCLDRNLLNDVLKMLCTFTTNCVSASQSLTLTTAVTGSGPRKLPSNLSLFTELVTLIIKEMDVISRTHNLNILELLFHIMHNSCSSPECRSILTKTNLLQSTSRLHPVITKRQKPWQAVELIWLEFLLAYTNYPEGQCFVAKASGILELIVLLTSSNKPSNKKAALLILRNIAFHQANRPLLLNSDDFLGVLQTKLGNGTPEEKYTVAIIMWALIANCQRAKLIFKSAQLDVKLQECVRRLTLSSDEVVEPEYIRKMHFVLGILTECADKVR